MTTEIELKYLVLGDNIAETLSEIFKRENIQFNYQEKQLANCYFDTPDLQLRKLDMGLRIRRDQLHIEQTIKTAGQVVGGLHSRPEFNVDIEGNFPVLSLFPNHIWSSTKAVEKIQDSLITLFSTDFKRCIWLVSDHEGNEVEVAFDQGVVASGERTEHICEIELELVKGNAKALFSLVEVLFSDLLMRPGLKSKAARGYALWKNDHLEAIHAPLFICNSDTNSIEQAFTLGLNKGLTELQQNIALYLTTESLTELATIKANLAILRHGFWLFDEHLPEQIKSLRTELSHFIHLLAWVDNAIHLQELTNKTGNYRKKLDYSCQLIEQLKIAKRRFPSADDISELLHSSRFNMLQLSLLKVYLSRANANSPASDEKRIALIKFAQDKIQFSLGEISLEMKSSLSFNCEQYIAQSKLLYRSLLTGTWLSGLFDSELRDNFRRPWLDLQQGISELQSLWIIQQQLEKLDEPPKKLVLWQNSKVEGLLIALDNTKAMATAMTPYWLEVN